MHLSIFPIAEADVITLMKSINRVIINPVIFFLFAVAMVYFLYGLAQYFLSPDNEEIRKQSRAQMIWGIVGLFIMVAVFGIMRVIINTFGVTNVKIQDNGDYTVNVPENPLSSDSSTKDYTLQGSDKPEYNLVGNYLGSWDASKNSPMLSSGIGVKDSYYITYVAGATNLDGVSSWEVGDGVYFDGLKWIKRNQFTSVDASRPLTYLKPAWSDPTISPLLASYVSSELCWRKAVYSKASTEYQARAQIGNIARAAFLSDTGQSDATADKNLPVPAETQIVYDATAKNYYFWWGAVAPVGKGKISDCSVIPLPTHQSTKSNPFPYESYGAASNASYYVVADSGVDLTLSNARNIAIQNALIQIAIQKKATSITDITYTVLNGKYYPSDPTTKNFDYWIVIQSPK